MNKKNKIVVFDFDGVVCDSTDECMVTSWNAWEEWESRDHFRNDLSKFTENDKLNFRKVRPRVRGAGEYYILRRAFSEGVVIDDQEIYDKLEEQWQENIKLFKVVFFKARERLRQNDINAWIGLHPVFDDVIRVMKILNDQNRLYIATLKDAKSVKLILKSKGLNIEKNRLLDQSKITSKLQALDKFRKQIGCGKKDMIFIDDNVTHILKPKAAGYLVYLATWGGVLREYVEIAASNNIPLLDESSFLTNW
jgi:phosphoglycolate phosphatase-like HAD superfamily hydrolase